MSERLMDATTLCIHLNSATTIRTTRFIPAPFGLSGSAKYELDSEAERETWEI
jgi:hypothetical protein